MAWMIRGWIPGPVKSDAASSTARHRCNVSSELMGRRLEKNYSFCEPCFLSLLYWKYPTYISDKMYSKSDQNTKYVFWKNNDFVTPVFRAYLDYN